MSVRDFYDGPAADYHLVYGGDWDTAVEQQGTALDRLIRYSTLTRAAEDAGFADVTWHEPDDSGMRQPVLAARAAA